MATTTITHNVQLPASKVGCQITATLKRKTVGGSDIVVGLITTSVSATGSVAFTYTDTSSPEGVMLEYTFEFVNPVCSGCTIPNVVKQVFLGSQSFVPNPACVGQSGFFTVSGAPNEVVTIRRTGGTLPVSDNAFQLDATGNVTIATGAATGADIGTFSWTQVPTGGPTLVCPQTILIQDCGPNVPPPPPPPAPPAPTPPPAPGTCAPVFTTTCTGNGNYTVSWTGATNACVGELLAIDGVCFSPTWPGHTVTAAQVPNGTISFTAQCSPAQIKFDGVNITTPTCQSAANYGARLSIAANGTVGQGVVETMTVNGATASCDYIVQIVRLNGNNVPVGMSEVNTSSFTAVSPTVKQLVLGATTCRNAGKFRLQAKLPVPGCLTGAYDGDFYYNVASCSPPSWIIDGSPNDPNSTVYVLGASPGATIEVYATVAGTLVQSSTATGANDAALFSAGGYTAVGATTFAAGGVTMQVLVNGIAISQAV
jgi:hypothetical protein